MKKIFSMVLYGVIGSIIISFLILAAEVAYFTYGLK